MSERIHVVVHGECIVHLIDHAVEGANLRYISGDWKVLNGLLVLTCWSDSSLGNLHSCELYRILTKLKLVTVHDQPRLPIDLQ